MLFYGFLVVVALGLVVLFVRSTMFRQLRRGHGNDRPHGDARDHAFKNTEYNQILTTGLAGSEVVIARRLLEAS